MSTPGQLIEGFRKFRAQHIAAGDVLYRQLVTQGQTPKTLIVGCCDSRVDPAIVLNCAPGDLFVIRNVANLVPPAENHSGFHGTTAALEYGVRTLGVEHIIVFGHAQCGGIRALMERIGEPDPNSFIDDWMHLAEAAKKSVDQDLADAAPEVRTRACEQRAIGLSLQNLMTFPWVRERVEAGALSLRGWYFDIEQGQLLEYDADSREFIAL